MIFLHKQDTQKKIKWNLNNIFLIGFNFSRQFLNTYLKLKNKETKERKHS